MNTVLARVLGQPVLVCNESEVIFLYTSTGLEPIPNIEASNTHLHRTYSILLYLNCKKSSFSKYAALIDVEGTLVLIKSQTVKVKIPRLSSSSQKTALPVWEKINAALPRSSRPWAASSFLTTDNQVKPTFRPLSFRGLMSQMTDLHLVEYVL